MFRHRDPPVLGETGCQSTVVDSRLAVIGMSAHGGSGVFCPANASVTRMRRSQRLDTVLVSLTHPDPRRAAASALVDPRPPDRAFVCGLEALVRHWTGDFDGAVEAARRGLAIEQTDADTSALLASAASLALAGSLCAPAEWWQLLERDLERAELSDAMRAPLVALLIEAALSCARPAVAVRLAARSAVPRELLGRPDHPFLTVIRCISARLLLFAGDLHAAEAAAAEAVAGAGSEFEAAFARACAATVAGNADRRAVTRAAVRELAAIGVLPEHLMSTGVHLLAAYAASAQGDVTAAAALALSAGGDAELSRVRIIDRAFCFELLVRVALERGDLDAAEAWAARVEPLAAHPVVDSTASRIGSRIALARRDPTRALQLAESSIAQASTHGRTVEASEGEILAARARIALHRGGDAARRLDEVVSAANRRGHRAVRLAAARELRRAGRRLAPDPTSGWTGLSEREREVAALVAQGASNADIAAELFLSVHTVRAHVSRILQAFGVATRVEVAQRVTAPELPRRTGSDLTQRQREVAVLVAGGASNARIAAELGVGVSTVEKHVTAILRQWDLPSRAGVAGQLVLEEDCGA